MNVHGVFLLDKPLGLSSNAAMQRARRLLDARKAGHGGTLDPLATGLLPVLLGEGCKLAETSLEGDKGYQAEILLGTTTTTDDAEGAVVQVRDVPKLTPEGLEQCLSAFRGEIQQVPPVFSAVKVGGQPLYRKARAGLPVEPPAVRKVTIHALTILNWTAPRLQVDVQCSKGTYIRALARDIGGALGCGAHLSGLRRTRTGTFSVQEAHSLEALEAMSPAERLGCVIPLERLIEGRGIWEIGEDALAAFRQGMAVAFSGRAGEGSSPDTERPCAVFCAGRLVGLGRFVQDRQGLPRVQPVRVIQF